MTDQVNVDLLARIVELEAQVNDANERLSVLQRSADMWPADDPIKLAIGLPLVNRMSETAFWKNFMRMEKPKIYQFLMPEGAIPSITAMSAIRNSLVAQALECGATHLLQMDTDQDYPLDTIPRLLTHVRNGLDIVTAKVHRRYPPFDSLMMRRNPDVEILPNGRRPYVTLTIAEWLDKGLVEVDATGTGCMLVNLDVFEKLEYPWFDSDAEDIGFCEKAKEAGYKVMVDTSLEGGHYSESLITKEFHVLYCSLLEKQQRKKE